MKKHGEWRGANLFSEYREMIDRGNVLQYL